MYIVFTNMCVYTQNIRTGLKSLDFFKPVFIGPGSRWMRIFKNRKERITPKSKGKAYCSVVRTA